MRSLRACALSRFSARASSTLPHLPLDSLQESRVQDLRRSLFHGVAPSRIWAHYTNLLNYFSYDVLPLELHQQVLRQCSPPAHSLRLSDAKRLIQGKRLGHRHLHEGRFQAVISNIRALGCTPSLDDYHFILGHFAAVGYHIGSYQVYQEIIHLGLIPQPRTFGLCLQAIAHRLTLPTYEAFRDSLVAQTRKTLDDLMSDMRKFDVPFTSANLDLALRIFKETVDKEGFDKLVKWIYGIDLDNPDCLPLELLENQTTAVQPLSTHALNTIIDTLGRFGDISRLVQAFEVLTQPLPQAKQHLFSSFDDEDDFGVPVNVPSPPNFTIPYALPNTTTYSTLLRHISRANHSVLARHYLIQAFKLDRQIFFDLYSQIEEEKPLAEIKAPRFSVNHDMILSVSGHANRHKDLGLMRWLWNQMPKILRTRRMDLEYFTELRTALGIPIPDEYSPSYETEDVIPTTRVSSSYTRQPLSLHSPTLPAAGDVHIFGSALDVDVKNPKLPEPTREKTFDINLHISILTHELEKLSLLASNLDQILGRTTQRRKERLGRRVWGARDIYLLDENRRQVVAREHWQQAVNFRPRRELVGGPQPAQWPDHRTRDAVPHLRVQTPVKEKPPLTSRLLIKLRGLKPS